MSKKPKCKACGNIGIHPLTIDYKQCKITRAEKRFFWRKMRKITKMLNQQGGE